MDLVLKRRLPYWMKTFEEIFEEEGEGEKRKLFKNLNWVFFFSTTTTTTTFCSGIEGFFIQPKFSGFWLYYWIDTQNVDVRKGKFKKGEFSVKSFSGKFSWAIDFTENCHYLKRKRKKCCLESFNDVLILTCLL